MSQVAIAARSLCKSYRRGGEELQVLDHLDLEMGEGTFYALMGPSGSGKTTLLNLIGGLDQADSGELIVAGASIAGFSGSELSQWRADHVGFVFQGFNLIPVLTAFENVMLPLSLAPLSKKQAKEHAMHALDLVGMSDRAKHRPRQLSGGQEQRVSIARAIVTDPAVLLADEPTGDLDRASADSVLELMQKLNSEMTKTVLMVTHDPAAAAYAQKIVHLDKGRLERIEDNAPLAKS